MCIGYVQVCSKRYDGFGEAMRRASLDAGSTPLFALFPLSQCHVLIG